MLINDVHQQRSTTTPLMDAEVDFDSLDELRRWMDEFLWPEGDGRQRSKRERILRAASELLVEFGYRKASVEDVAVRAGIAKGTVYLYYRNKAELVFHAIALEKYAYLGRFSPLLDASVDPRDRLRSFIALSLVLAREMPLMARVARDRELELAIDEVDTSLMIRINDYQTAFMVHLLNEATTGQLPEETLGLRAQVLLELLYAATLAPQIIRAEQSLASYAAMVAGILVDGITCTRLEPLAVAIPGLLTEPADSAQSASHKLQETYS